MLVSEHQPASREVIDHLLLGTLPEVLTQAKKLRKIHNLMSSQSGKVTCDVGTRKGSK